MIRTAGLEGRESPSPPPEQQTCRAEWLQCGPAGVGRLARLAPGRGKVVDGLHGVLVSESLGASVSLSENFQVGPQGQEGCLREKPTDPRKREAHLAMPASLPLGARRPAAQLPTPSLSTPGWRPSGEAQRPGSGTSCPRLGLLRGG